MVYSPLEKLFSWNKSIGTYPAGLGCGTIAGFHDRSTQAEERVLILLTAHSKGARWFALEAFKYVNTRSEQAPRQRLLRHNDCCFQCVVNQAISRSGRWLVILWFCQSVLWLVSSMSIKPTIKSSLSASLETIIIHLSLSTDGWRQTDKPTDTALKPVFRRHYIHSRQVWASSIYCSAYRELWTASCAHLLQQLRKVLYRRRCRIRFVEISASPRDSLSAGDRLKMAWTCRDHWWQ